MRFDDEPVVSNTEVGEWSECDTDCGTGTQERDVFCSTGYDSDCDPAGKPNTETMCERYAGCDGCGFPSDCRTTTLNDMVKGYVPGIVNRFLPTIHTTSIFPVTTCICTDQCIKNKEKLADSKMGVLPMSDPIHDTCFYDHHSKGCGCIHGKTFTGHTWKVVGTGLCEYEPEKPLRNGFMVWNKEDRQSGMVIGSPITFRHCKKLCIEDGNCQGVYYGASKTWLPVIGSSLSSGTSKCFIYTTSAAQEKKDMIQSLRENYSARFHISRVTGDITGASWGPAKSADNLGRADAWTKLGQINDWVSTDLLGAWAFDEANGHCYKLVRE
jgi:hypothetical protein